MKKILLVIDMQNGFARYDETKELQKRSGNCWKESCSMRSLPRVSLMMITARIKD